MHADDPRLDLVGVLERPHDVLARQPVILGLARECDVFGVESVHRVLCSMDRLLRRAIDAAVVRPELEVRDRAAIIDMARPPCSPTTPTGTDRRRYLALLAGREGCGHLQDDVAGADN